MSELIPISVSRLGNFKSCQRRYYYRYVDKLKEKQKSLALSAGGDAHALIEGMYKGELPDIAQLSDRALTAYNAYSTYAGLFDDFTVTHTELEFNEPIEGTPFKLKGFIDAVVQRDGQLWIMEHKTTGRYWNSKRIALDEQPVIYEVLAQDKLGQDVTGTIRNFIRLTERKGSYYGEVKREYVLTNPAKQVEVFNNMLDTADQMAHALEQLPSRGERAFTRSPGEQCSWCPFFMICETAYQGGDVEYVKDTYFDREGDDTTESETSAADDDNL